jgi:hypothetical protein
VGKLGDEMKRVLWVVLVSALMSFSVCWAQSETTEGETVVWIEKETHFTDTNANDVVLAPGVYRIESHDSQHVTVISEDGETRVELDSQQIDHEEVIESQQALSLQTGEDTHTLVLLLPGGRGLEATGSYSGVKPRGGLSPAPLPLGPGGTGTKYIPPPPYIVSFAINSGAKSTSSRRVTLSIKHRNASRYRASESRYFTGASWIHLGGSTQSFELSKRTGTKTVYVQLKNAYGQVSKIGYDSIILKSSDSSPLSDITLYAMQLQAKEAVNMSAEELREALADRTALASIDGSEAYSHAEFYGFTFSATPQDPTSDCSIYTSGNDLILSTGIFFLGGKCDFVLFGGRNLDDGWTYKSHEIDLISDSSKSGYSIIEKPQVGSSSIRFKIHAWSEAGVICKIRLRSLTLEGPALEILDAGGAWPAFR